MSRLAFVTNFCPHYRVKTFETIARQHDVDYYFFSAGRDWYWMREHGVHAGEFRAQYLPGIEIAGTRLTPTLPVALWRGRYDAIVKCINGRFALPITYLAARITARPFILWTGVWKRIHTPAHRLFFPLTRYIYRHADAVVVYGQHVAQFLENEGVSPDRIFIAPHAIDNELYGGAVSLDELEKLRASLQIPKYSKVILYVGRLEQAKGLEVLLDAFTKLAIVDSILLFVGSGAQRELLERLSRANKVEGRVRFTGYVPPIETIPYYALATVCVLPSVETARFKEPWGLVVNEAFAQGTPVVATDAVGAAAGGLVQDSLNGFVVPQRNVEQLADAIRRIVDDDQLRIKMSEEARRTIAGWNNERMAAGFGQAIRFAMRES